MPPKLPKFIFIQRYGGGENTVRVKLTKLGLSYEEYPIFNQFHGIEWKVIRPNSQKIERELLKIKEGIA